MFVLKEFGIRPAIIIVRCQKPVMVQGIYNLHFNSLWCPNTTDISQRNMTIVEEHIIFGHFTKFQSHQKLMAKMESYFLASSLCKLKSIYLSRVILLVNHHFKREKGRSSCNISDSGVVFMEMHISKRQELLYHRETGNPIKEYRLTWPLSKCTLHQGFRQLHMQPFKVLSYFLNNNQKKCGLLLTKLQMQSENGNKSTVARPVEHRGRYGHVSINEMLGWTEGGILFIF